MHIAPAAPVPAEQIVGTAAVEAETGNAAKEVVILTEDNFDAETAAGDWLVELYRILRPPPPNSGRRVRILTTLRHAAMLLGAATASAWPPSGTSWPSRPMNLSASARLIALPKTVRTHAH
jgi:hypothetical protein